MKNENPLLATAAGRGGTRPKSLNLFRGNSVSGRLPEVLAPDNIKAMYSLGFVLNELEARVRLISGGTPACDTPTSLSYLRKSSAGTLALETATDALNFSNGLFEVVEERSESSSTDVTSNVDMPGGIIDFVGAVGRRQAGFSNNFPREGRVDQVGWEAI